MNLNDLLADPNAGYDDDLEPDNYGLDTCPIDLDPIPLHWDHTDAEPPCNYCHTTRTCTCIDRGSPHRSRW